MALPCLLLLGAIACSEDKGSAPPDAESANPLLWEFAWSEATEVQREAMEDGEVSFAEYEAAALRTVACINEIGGGLYGEAILNEHTGEFALAARRDPQPGPRLDPNSVESLRQRAATEDCYREHWNGVHQAWTAQYAPSEQQINEARQALAQCLRDAGVDVPDPASQQDFAGLESHEAFFRCVERTSEEFGIANFAG